MNTEDFVTYEQAVKLKELGFDWECQTYYTNDYVNDDPEDLSREVKFNHGSSYNQNIIVGCFSAPTLAQAAKWLREEWGLHIAASPFTDGSIDADGRQCDEWEFWDFGIIQVHTGSFVMDYGDREFDTYEAALSAGIDAALELKKITHEKD